jgi:hypothetical protein
MGAASDVLEIQSVRSPSDRLAPCLELADTHDKEQLRPFPGGNMADCDSIVRDVAELRHRVLELTEMAAEAANPEERQLALSARHIAQSQLAARERDLKACLSSKNRLRDPRVFGFEVNQGLIRYELVAGKATLFRVFLGVPPDVLAPPQLAAGGPQVISNETLFRTSKLDYASLSIRGPDGVTFEVHGDLDNGEITNYSRSYDEHDNANFYVDGASLDKPGRYQALARFYRRGSLVGRVDLGRHTFQATKDLRLLIVVDTWPMPLTAWNTLFGALEHVQRAFPVRAGVGPLGGGQFGLRYEIDPNPFNPDFPGWGPLRQRFTQFNAAQQAQGQPDRVEHILSVRVQQPVEPPRGGRGDAGPGGSVTGVVLNWFPSGDDTFATLISQELGHNFLGAAHTPKATIGDASAFDLVGRRSIPWPRSIMYRYYSDTASEDGLFLPKDWSTIRKGLLATTSTGNA